MDRASLFFLTKGIVTQCFPLLITSLAICKSILQQLIHDFNAQSKLHSCLLFQREGWLSFIKKKEKNKIDISFHRSHPCGVQISKSLEFHHQRTNCISDVSFFGISSFERVTPFEYQKWTRSIVLEWGTDHRYPSNTMTSFKPSRKI